MTSRSDRLRAFLTENGPFEGSVGDLADEMPDPSPNALSAAVSVAVKEGWLRRHPQTAGAKAEWLWLAEHDVVARVAMREAGVDLDAPPVEPEPWPTEVRPDPDESRVVTHDSRLTSRESTLEIGVLHDGNVPPEQIDAVLGVVHPDPPVVDLADFDEEAGQALARRISVMGWRTKFRVRVDVTSKLIEVVHQGEDGETVEAITLDAARRLQQDLGSAILMVTLAEPAKERTA